MAPDAARAAGPRDCTILVAEDDAGMRELVVEVLRNEGYFVIEAADGGTLRQRALESPDEALDLVVSDIRLPGGNGLSVLEALHRMGRVVPVILMTAFGNDETRRRVEELGGVLFAKPFELGDLRDAVRKLLSGTRPVHSGTGSPHRC